MSLYGMPQKKGVYENIIKITEDTSAGILCFKGFSFFTALDERTGKCTKWNCATVTMARNQVAWDKGILWERTLTGLSCFDLVNKKVYRMRAYNTESDKVLQTPFSIYKDRSGMIWIGTGGYGLLKYNPHAETFHKTLGSSVTWMSATPSGDVLIMDGEIKNYERESSQEHPVYKISATFTNKLLAHTKEDADMILQDHEGIYWVNVGRPAKFSLQTNTLRFLHEPDRIFPCFLDNKDRFCYATATNFCFADKKNNALVYYPFPVTGMLAMPYKFCQVIYQGSKGIFWLGTTQGLFSFNETTKQWRQYKNKPGDSTSISNDIIFSICDDPSAPGDYIWAGTNGGGLNRLCISKGTFEHVDTKDGLPSMVVYGILPDDDKQLWMSTNNGIARLKLTYSYNKSGGVQKITEKKFMYYYEENGLQGNEFNRYAYCKTKDGTMFFGGVNGFNYFDPKQVSVNTSIPNIIITGFKMGNKTISFQAGNNIEQTGKKQLLSKPVFLTKSIEVPYSANMVSFDFAALDYTSPEKNLYQYKLENFDNEWIQSGHTHSATYTNLDPGKYIFMVKGSNNDGIWNEQGSSVILTILTPWYKSWWYKTSLLAASIGWLFLFFRYRLQQKLKLYDIRNNIAGDLHDEIGSTLSSVFIYSEVARQTIPDKDSKTFGYLEQIGTDAANMIDALNDIIWTVNAKNDRFENIINRMRGSAIELFEAKGYHLHLEFDEQLNLLRLGMEKRKNFYLIYKEAINNAAKYAGGKHVWITLTYVKPFLHLLVKDDGCGFGIDHKAFGNGLANMQKRAAMLNGKLEIISSPGNGTAIKLEFKYS